MASLGCNHAACAPAPEEAAAHRPKETNPLDTFYLVLISVILYGVANALLNYLERIRGARLEHRRPILFVVILVLAVITVKTMGLLMKPAA